jgi:circadian clock protein KaiB
MMLSPDPSINDENETLMITLYIAGTAVNSLRALANLKALCEEHFEGRYHLEVVDIFDTPLRALNDRVLMTPTLIKTAPLPRILIVGDLRDTQTVLLGLQSTNGKNE